MKSGPTLHVVLVDRPGGRAQPPWARRARHCLRSAAEVRDALHKAGARQLWVAPHRRAVAWLLQALATHPVSRPHAHLLLGCDVDVESLTSLRAAFAAIVPRAQAQLAGDELVEVLESDHPEDYCIGASVIDSGEQLLLYRGDFSVVVVALASLRRLDASGLLDPHRLALQDGGQTIALGDYEVAFDALLIERDAAYRRRANARRVDTDRSFGGCLRRLRLLKRVPRDGFRGISAKTVARIERGEVSAPREATLRTLARRLGVKPEEIVSY